MPNVNGLNVASFYSGKSVFVTGGTGFVGKTLIEKLLYSCRGIDKIYVLVRDKHGEQASERLARITSSPVFDRLKVDRNEELEKITVISGDITRECLGLSDDVLKILEDEVSVVFHLAATVVFKVSLKDAMQININGTENVMELCRRMKLLEAFVHVSTAFSNSDRKDIEEVVYPMPMKLEIARIFAEMFSHDDEIVSKFMGKKPNTYTFSKAFAEELVMKQCEVLPAAIVRPSIEMLRDPNRRSILYEATAYLTSTWMSDFWLLTALNDCQRSTNDSRNQQLDMLSEARRKLVVSAFKEPCPGWIDTWNGPIGLLIGMSAGVLKVTKGVGRNIADLVPVDIVTNLIIVAATKCQKSKQIKVYNCCTGRSNPITCDGASAISRRVALRFSLNEFPWPFLMFTSRMFLYNLITFTLQIIPAYLIDLWCIITGKKATQMKIQNRLKKFIDAVKFFSLNEWRFSDDNVTNLVKTMSAADREMFNIDVRTINWETHIRDYILGARKYLLNLEK